MKSDYLENSNALIIEQFLGETSPWTALTMYLGMKTKFIPNMKKIYIFIKMHTNSGVAIKPNFMSYLLQSTEFL